MTVNNVQTVQTAPTKAIAQIKPEQFDEKSESNMTKKVLLGATALAAIAVAGIYIAKSRRNPKNLTSQKPAGLAKPESKRPKTPEATVQTVKPEPPKAKPEYTKQTLEEFKKTGKFENGKAITNKGEVFNGQLTNESKDGSKFVLEYKDGLVRSVKKLNGEEQVFEKTFAYNPYGQIRSISKNGKETAEFLYDEQGRKFVFRRFEDNMHYFFNKDGKLDHAIDMKKAYSYVDSNGISYGYELNHNRKLFSQIASPDGKIEETFVIGSRFFNSSWVGEHPKLAEKYKGKYHWEMGQNIKQEDAISFQTIYRYSNYGENWDNTYQISRVIDVDKNMKRHKSYCFRHFPNDIKIKCINHNEKKILELCADSNGKKILGRYNIETGEFTDLNGITAEEAKTQLDKIFEAGKLLKEKVLELYKAQRKENLYWSRLDYLRGIHRNQYH